ncbi:MAG TPA: hypothetical protein VK943_17680, partial [Arenibaculum sp.]|nr:hypothetical protein [Arenibaculum sp.]
MTTGARSPRRPAGVIPLLRYHGLVFRRNVVHGGLWRGGDVLIVTIGGLIKLPDFARGCLVAADRVRTGAVDGWPRVEMLLAILLLAWIVLPVLVRSVDPAGPGLSPVRMRRYPYSVARLLLVGATGALVQPIYWLLLAASAMVFVPLLSRDAPVPGFVAGVFHLGFCAVAPWIVWLSALAVLSLPRRWLLLLAALALLAGTILYRLNSARIAGIGAADVVEFLRRLTGWLPGHWVARAAAGDGWLLHAGALLLVAVFGFGLAAVLLARVLNHPGSTDSAKRTLRRPAPAPWPGLDPSGRALLSREILYTAGTLDFWIGLAIGFGIDLYIVLATEPPAWVLLVGLVAIALSQLPAALNSFGLDGRAIDRFRLLPVTGREILVAKNRAYFVMTLVQIVPLLLVSLLRIDAGIVAAAMAGTFGALLLTATWGNLISVQHPAPRPFVSLDSSEVTGGIIGTAVSLVIWLIPLVLTLFTLTAGLKFIILEHVVFALACLALYSVLLPRS